MKGTISTGGNGTRLYPLTIMTSKRRLPICDEHMAYYPYFTLMLAEIQDIPIIFAPSDLPNFERLLEEVSPFDIQLSYKEPPFPDGLVQEFTLEEEFVEDNCMKQIREMCDNVTCLEYRNAKQIGTLQKIRD